ncbi:unnamed protein product [Hydatigera taeniaeformis]|uniref:Uncharacterized protein n=1 Tax=Hydatigena taeniaeformis TaxID=6205 RepID=A0A0R3XBK6_HYDTA|nr:unnamed protein product [Hydatigera taeniaeformis]
MDVWKGAPREIRLFVLAISTDEVKWTSDAERRVRNPAKASSCKTSTSVHRRNGTTSDNGAHRQRSGESASRSSRNGHDKQSNDRKRHNSRHLNTVGIMDNILAGKRP